jgi:hypothetical protein
MKHIRKHIIAYIRAKKLNLPQINLPTYEMIYYRLTRANRTRK